MTGDREAALDLMQDTFFSAFKEIKRFRGEASFSSWLYKIASNKALNYLRRKKLLSLLFLEDSPQVEPVYEMKEDIDAGKLAGAIEAGVRALPPKQKLVFNLRFYDKLQFGEIAKIAGKSESTVKTNYQKALENLRKRLESYR
jgi:RNA polymerase sigma-70 factor (ECF subfamily)